MFRFLCVTCLSLSFAAACELTMGYRTNEKPPLIAAAPDNSGLYIDLFTEAATRIDCQLKVVRAPKGRILAQLETGEIDFYPGLTYSSARSQYTQFIENGLQDGYIGITRRGEQEITELNQIAERNLVMLVSFGSFDLNAEQYGISVRRPVDYTLTQILELIKRKQGDFHAYNLLAVQHYLSTTDNWSADFMLHKNCCGPLEPMFLGFSKQSSHLQLISNPVFNPKQTASAFNQPNKAAPYSLAFALQRTLKEMQQDGSIDNLMARYFTAPTLP